MVTNDSFDEENYKKVFSETFDQEEKNFNELKKRKLVISLIGDVNVGKSSTINALTGRKLSEVGPFAGLTKEISVHRYSEDVLIADTPGLNDIDELVSEKAPDFVDKEADIILFFFNASVGPTKSMIDAYNNIKKLNKPIILVLNKIDIWYENGILEDPDDLKTVVNQINEVTGQQVIPISAKRNINIEILNEEIVNILESSGKEMLFLKISKYKEDKVNTWINGASVSAFGIGVIPIPAADIIPLTSLQVALALKIAYIYDCKVSKNDVMTLIGSTITGSVGKQLFKFGIQGLKGMGWIGGPFGTAAVSALAGSIASSMTFGFGHAAKVYYKGGMTMDLGSLGDIYQQNYKSRYDKDSGKEIF